MSTKTRRRPKPEHPNGTVTPQKTLLKLDFGAGMHKRDGFLGIDKTAFIGVDQVVDLTVLPWPWADESVEEAHASHFVEHLTADQRINFVNELYRVLIPGGKATIITPHWASCRAYGDLTHQWPPVSEFWFFYLSEAWRAQNAPHNDFYKCNFSITSAFSFGPELSVRNQEYQTFALRNYKEAALDTMATFVKEPLGKVF